MMNRIPFLFADDRKAKGPFVDDRNAIAKGTPYISPGMWFIRPKTGVVIPAIQINHWTAEITTPVLSGHKLRVELRGEGQKFVEIVLTAPTAA